MTKNTLDVQNILGRNDRRLSLIRARPQVGALPQNPTTGIVSGAINLGGSLRDVPDCGERVDIRHFAGHVRT